MVLRFRLITATVLSILVFTILGVTLSSVAPRVYALAHSSNVAYVTDFGSGVCDSTGPPIPGSSILRNAVTGAPPAGCPATPHFTTTGGNTITFTDITPTAIDAGGLAVLTPFDTVLLYEVCDIASHPATMTALNAYLTAGDGKVVFYDSDRCYGAMTPNYSTFLFPFTTSNPGEGGAVGIPTFIETVSPPAVLIRSLSGISTTFPSTDAIGDSNSFVTENSAWCVAEEGSLVADPASPPPVVGFQIGYARTTAGGLVIWDGNDNYVTSPNAWDTQVFSNILDQPFNPDSLPCSLQAAPPIPEYPLGLPLLAVFMTFAYAVIKRRTIIR